MDNASRFIDAMTTIEKFLRDKDPRRHERKHFVEFKTLVKETPLLVDKQKRDMYDFIDLRNAIVHSPKERGRAIADPRDSALKQVEHQVDLLTNPPKVLNASSTTRPTLLNESDGLERFLVLVNKQAYSQSLYRRADGTLGLVTTNAVARWIASEYEATHGIATESISLGDVETYSEEQDELICRPRNLTVVEAIRLFSGQSGRVPAAIAITHSGNPAEEPLGLAVRSDIANLVQVLEA